MRKIFLMAALIFSLISCTAFAATQEVKPNIGVLVIGSAEFKTPDYYKMIKSSVLSKSGLIADVGEDFQKKYQKFMVEKYDIGKHTPTKSDLVNFTANSGYRKLLVIVVDENLDTQNNADSRQKNRIAIQLDVYLCNRSEILDIANASREDDSKASIMRARKGAFQKSLNAALKALNFNKE